MLSSQFTQTCPQRVLRHLVEVHRRVKCAQYVALKLAERVAVLERDGNHPQMLMHPRRQLVLIDRQLTSRAGEDGAETQPEGRELVPPAEVHPTDATPQRVLRFQTAARPGRAREARVEQAIGNLEAQPKSELDGPPLVHPPAVKTGGAQPDPFRSKNSAGLCARVLSVRASMRPRASVLPEPVTSLQGIGAASLSRYHARRRPSCKPRSGSLT